MAVAARPTPGKGESDPGEESERRKSAGLMRVSHAGEVCAQALYSGQALVARDPRIRDALQAAGAEERDHLAWCRERIAHFKAPKRVVFVAQVPRAPNGKADYRTAKDHALSALGLA